MKIKTERIASSLLKEINDIIYSEIRDEDIKNTTATYVKLADDLSYAKVYCLHFNKDKADKAIKDLNNAKGFIKGELIRRKLPMRIVPNLEFVYDESIEYGKKIENIIEEINKD
jgi:ribosome-binding factor A